MVFREDLSTNLVHYKGQSRTKQIQQGHDVFYQEAARNPRIPAYRLAVVKCVPCVPFLLGAFVGFAQIGQFGVLTKILL